MNVKPITVSKKCLYFYSILIKNQKIMRDLIWLIVVILIIAWLLGYFAFDVGNLIHILLVIAVIVILYKLLTGRRL